MLKSLKIKNFRCFEEFDLPQLGRVNLLVGKNNSGKTSVLEAVHILDSVSPFSLWEALERRGEYFTSSKEEDISNINHFYLGHEIGVENEIMISGNTIDGSSNFSLLTNQDQEKLNDWNDWITEKSELNIICQWNFLSKSGYLNSQESFALNLRNKIFSSQNMRRANSKKSIFVSLSSSQISRIVELFNQIVITPQEEILYDALRFIEPKIERIAPTTIQGSRKGQHGGFVVAIDGKRVPIGSMGDGIWRILEITLAMVNIPGGTLLIDEIDTGLHFSVMIDLWKLICKTAEKLDVQVFATTHNSDCWKSLAEVANSDDIASDDITIHRIERGKKESIVFNEQEMAIAAERDIEVR
jgi:AAA15 family ATPase/GTPase